MKLIQHSENENTALCSVLKSGIKIAEKFENGTHVIIENAGHDLYMESPLIGDMVLNFFKGKELNVDRIVLEPTKFE